MRIAFLSLFLVFFAGMALPAVVPPLRPATSTAAYKRGGLMRKIKGALAVAFVICFGPLAYLGVRLLTRDPEIRRSAKQALIVWLTMVLVTSVVLFTAIALKPGPH